MFATSPSNQSNRKQKAVFLDRDGVLNAERGNYTYKVEDFEICTGAPAALKMLKEAGFLLIVITNQGGIAKGIYTKQDMLQCHKKLATETNNLIDAIYYSPDHPSVSASLSRKPDSLMLEKAIAKFGVDPAASFMIGDQPRDLEAAAKVGVKGIKIGLGCDGAVFACSSLLEAAEWILAHN